MYRQDLINASRIAWRYFFSAKSRNAVNIISIVSVIGIALVTMAMVIILSVFNGFEVFTNSQISRLSPPYKLVQDNGKTFSPSEIGLDDKRGIVEGEALVFFENESQAVRLIGVHSCYLKDIGLSQNIADGVADIGDEDVPMAIIGIGVAMQLGAGAEYLSPIEVKVPKRIGRLSVVNPNRSFISKSYHISGVFRLDQAEDNDLIILPINEVREMLQMEGDEVNFLALSESITPPKGYSILNRYEQHPDLYKVLSMEKWFSFALLLFVLLLSLFSVISTLGMLIIEKRDDMNTLHFLGASEKLTKAIPIIEGWLLSITGLVVGMIVGSILVWLQAKYGFVKLGNGDTTTFLIEAYPVDFRASDLLLVTAVMLIIGFLSSLLANKLFRRH